MDRKQTGYYRCKSKHQNAYKKICDAYQPYVSSDMLKMVSYLFYSNK